MLIFALVGIAGAALSAWLGEETAGKPLLQEAAAMRYAQRSCPCRKLSSDWSDVFSAG